MRIVFSGGGTGGHIFPAIAVAQEVKSRIPDSEILFIGAQGRMEMEKIPKAGFPIKGLWITGFQRKLTLQNLLFPAKLLSSIVKSYFILKKFKPDLVAGFGGFASGATLFVANQMKIPTLIQEQNSYPGITNRILGKKANVICLGYEGAAMYFDKGKIRYTGNPIRTFDSEMLSRDAAKEKLGFDPAKKLVLILGGSLGARTFNETMKNSFDSLRDEEKMQFLWQCGSGYIEEFKYSSTANLENVMVTAFIDNMQVAYAAADMVVSRAGALSVTELCEYGKAALLVPSPNVAEDHQTKNAGELLQKEACLMISDSKLQREMIGVLKKTLNDKNLRKELESNISKMAKPNAVKDITDQLLGLA